MDPEDMDEMLFSPFRQALGKETAERISRQINNYEYYSGKQHENEAGELVKAKDLERPPGLDYDPTRYATNYFKAIVDRKARWQMGGKHGIAVPRRQIDDMDDVLSEVYEPSDKQRKENERAENYERLIYDLWDDNRMRARLVQAARDRLIANRVVCKIVFRSEEHTSELQSRGHLVCRLLLEKKKREQQDSRGERQQPARSRVPDHDGGSATAGRPGDHRCTVHQGRTRVSRQGETSEHT